MWPADQKVLNGMKPAVLFEKILEAIDRGITTNQLRHDLSEYILSGKTKQIVINRGGEGLKVSYVILKEMEKRGDLLAKKIIDKNEFEKVPIHCIKEGNDQRWAYLEKDYGMYDRGNTTLIEILKEGQYENIGGWDLVVCNVPIESWAYKICKDDDIYRSEYIEGDFEYVIIDNDNDNDND